MNSKYVCSVITAIISLIIYYKYYPVLQLCELKTCPYCFGTDFCSAIEQNEVTLRYETFSDFMYNIFSVKNVYFAYYGDQKVVLKKLAHNSELNKLDLLKEDSVEEIMKFLISDSDSEVKNFRICDKKTAELFLETLKYKDNKHLQTLLQVNVEPILLEILSSKKGWCVPELYGYCGRLAVVEDTGRTLNEIKNFDWFDRAYVAYQILQAVINLTANHEIFRFYLTDISPDNIAVNGELKVTFIDLENVVLKAKEDGPEHYSEHLYDDSFVYSEKELCQSSISDHNLYGVCRLLLSRHVVSPMMKNGLLHDPPQNIEKEFKTLFKYIEICVYTPANPSRISISRSILQNLESILKNYTKYLD